MFQELVKRSLTKLKKISLFRLTICILLTYYFDNPIVVCSLFIYEITNSYEDGLVYVSLIFIIYLINTYNLNIIKIGLIEEVKNNYYVIDNFLYKTSLYTKDKLKIGDIVKIPDAIRNSDNTFLKKNIVYTSDKYELLNCLNIKNRIYEYINSFNDDIRLCLNKFIYNQNSYDDNDLNLAYSFTLYYFFRYLKNKNNILCLISLLVYCLLFKNQIKFIIIFIDLFLSVFKVNKLNKLCITLIIILFNNIYLIDNNSILIALLFSLYSCLDLNIGFNTYMFLIDSFIFKKIDIIYTFGFKYILKFQFILLIFSFVILFIPNLANVYLQIINLYSFINSINLSVRGSLSLIGLIMFALTYKLFKNENYRLLILCLILISPFNYPFYSVDFIDVGQGDCILIRNCLNKANILIDTGSKFNYYKLQKYLYSKGIYSIDYLIITHNDSDHNGNIDNLKNDFKVKEIIDEPKNLSYKDINLKSINKEIYDNDNDNSLVYEMNLNNLIFLFTGDISTKCENDLINNNQIGNIDVLKVSHHGSNSASSQYFLSNTLPEFSIISTSGQYNHPHIETINNLEQFKSKYFITKDDGNIRFIMFKGFNLIKTDKWEFVIIKG